MRIIEVEDYALERINSRESESGIIATLIRSPDYLVYADGYLEPKHFTNIENKCMYMAIYNLFHLKGVS